MARSSALAPVELLDLPQEYALMKRRATVAATRSELALWEGFFRGRAHILAQAESLWSADRILLQLAVEHAGDSPVTKAAEAWLAAGACDWTWLRARYRPDQVERPALRWVANVHKEQVLGVVQVGHEYFATWDKAGTLVSWSDESPTPFYQLPGSPGRKMVEAIACGADHFVTRSSSGDLVRHSVRSALPEWRFETGSPQTSLLRLTDGRFVSLGGDGVLLLWRDCERAPAASLQLPGGGSGWSVVAAWADRLLAWTQDGRVVLVSGRGDALVAGALWRFPDGELRTVRPLREPLVATGSNTCTVVADLSTGTEVFRTSGCLLDADATGGLLVNNGDTAGYIPSARLLDPVAFNTIRELAPTNGHWQATTPLFKAHFGSHGAAVSLTLYDCYAERDGSVIECASSPWGLSDFENFSIIGLDGGGVSVVPHGEYRGRRLEQPDFAGAFDLQDSVLSVGRHGEIRLWDPAGLLSPTVSDNPSALCCIGPVMGEVAWGISLETARLMQSDYRAVLLSLRSGRTLAGNENITRLLPLTSGRCLTEQWKRSEIRTKQEGGHSLLEVTERESAPKDRLIGAVGVRVFTASKTGLCSADLDGGSGQYRCRPETDDNVGESQRSGGEGELDVTAFSSAVLMPWRPTETFVVLDDGRLVASIELTDGSSHPGGGSKWFTGVWSAQTGALLAQFEGLASDNCSVDGVVHLGDDRVVAWSSPSHLGVWSLVTGKLERVLQAEGERISGAQLRPNGRLLSWSGEIRTREFSQLRFQLWNLQTGTCERRMSAAEAEQVSPELFLEAGLRPHAGQVVAQETGHYVTLHGLPGGDAQLQPRWYADGDVRPLLVTEAHQVVANVAEARCVVLQAWRGHVPLSGA